MWVIENSVFWYKNITEEPNQQAFIFPPLANVVLCSLKATQSTLDVYEADIEDRDYQHHNVHGDIIFPDSYEQTRKKNTSPVTSVVRLGTTPICAEDSTFCEDIDTYPYEQVKNALSDWEEETMPDVFGADEAPTEIIANR